MSGVQSSTMMVFAVALLMVLSTPPCVTPTSAAKVLVYPFGHCLNSHLLIAEKLAGILSGGGHDVHMLLSDSYDGFEHHSDETRSRHVAMRHHCIAKQDLPASDGDVVNPGSSCSPQEETLQSSGDVKLIQFAVPDNYHPVCEYDTLNFMLDATATERWDGLFQTLILYCDRILSDTQLLARLKNSSYQVLIAEALDPCSGILADYLKVPFILFVTTGLGQMDPNPRLPSYLPVAIAPFTDQMEFSQRVVNFLLKLLYDVVIPNFVAMNAPFEQLRVKYQLSTSPSLDDIFKRAALRLVNSDFTLDYPAPIHPDNILVGGFAVNRHPAPLPADLEQFVEGSGDAGVIVVSFGTLVRHYGPHWTRLFAAAFARLPQRVVWRHYGNETSVNDTTLDYGDRMTSSNVLMMPWLPQASLLAHPKTRLFVSHCGLNAIFEAAHYGVPVLAIPLSVDQHNHAAKLAGPRLGMALKVDIRTMTSDSLYKNILTLLTHQKYQDNAKRASQLLADQPSSPADRIRFWVDYVVRHRGASQLQSESARRLTSFQYYSVDVAVCLLVALILVIIVASLLLRLGVGVVRYILRKTFN